VLHVSSVHFIRAIAVVVVTALLAASHAPAAVVVDSLLVRIYDNAGVVAADLTAALKTTYDILRRADLGVDWVRCGARRDGPVSSVCDTPAEPGDLVVRLIVGADKDNSERRALGYTLFDNTGTNGFATVYVDRVEWLARRAQHPRAPILGRAIAHEIGHLLLRSNEHTQTGLMREVWTIEQVIRNRRDDWSFSADQSTDLRNARLSAPGSPRAVPRTPRPTT
jgi:hypothetical protein